MGIINRLLASFPTYNWCGCRGEVTSIDGYQFRVKAQKDSSDNLFQIRQKETCRKCDENRINVLVEETCNYDPSNAVHHNKVGYDEDEMQHHGFMSQEELARMLIEMRLSDSLDLSE